MTQQQPALILRLVAAAWLLLQPCIADATLPCTYVSTSAEITTVLGAAIGSHRLCIEEQHTILAQPAQLSFADNPPLYISAGSNVTIECPEGLQLNLHSTQGTPFVEEGAQLALEGCDVMTVATRASAATGPPPLAYMDAYLGMSRGTLRLLRSRLLLPSEFFRLYVGVYVHAFPEVTASTHPRAHFRGSRVHMTPSCLSLAVAYTSTRFVAVPQGVTGATYVFENSTIWFSSQSQEVADDVIREAEEARISGQDIVFAYGAAVNPNGEAVAVSSELGNLPADVLPMFSGALLQGWVSEESKIGSSLHEMSQVAGRDNGVPCMQRGGDESSVSQLPLGVVVVQEDETPVVVTQQNVALLSTTVAPPDSASGGNMNLSLGVIITIAVSCTACVTLLCVSTLMMGLRPKQMCDGYRGFGRTESKTSKTNAADTHVAISAPETHAHIPEPCTGSMRTHMRVPHFLASDAGDQKDYRSGMKPPAITPPVSKFAEKTGEGEGGEVSLRTESCTANIYSQLPPQVLVSGTRSLDSLTPDEAVVSTVHQVAGSPQVGSSTQDTAHRAVELQPDSSTSHAAHHPPTPNDSAVATASAFQNSQESSSNNLEASFFFTSFQPTTTAINTASASATQRNNSTYATEPKYPYTTSPPLTEKLSSLPSSLSHLSEFSPSNPSSISVTLARSLKSETSAENNAVVVSYATPRGEKLSPRSRSPPPVDTSVMSIHSFPPVDTSVMSIPSLPPMDTSVMSIPSLPLLPEIDVIPDDTPRQPENDVPKKIGTQKEQIDTSDSASSAPEFGNSVTLPLVNAAVTKVSTEGGARTASVVLPPSRGPKVQATFPSMRQNFDAESLWLPPLPTPAPTSREDYVTLPIHSGSSSRAKSKENRSRGVLKMFERAAPRRDPSSHSHSNSNSHPTRLRTVSPVPGCALQSSNGRGRSRELLLSPNGAPSQPNLAVTGISIEQQAQLRDALQKLLAEKSARSPATHSDQRSMPERVAHRSSDRHLSKIPTNLRRHHAPAKSNVASAQSFYYSQRLSSLTQALQPSSLPQSLRSMQSLSDAYSPSKFHDTRNHHSEDINTYRLVSPSSEGSQRPPRPSPGPHKQPPQASSKVSKQDAVAINYISPNVTSSEESVLYHNSGELFATLDTPKATLQDISAAYRASTIPAKDSSTTRLESKSLMSHGSDGKSSMSIPGVADGMSCMSTRVKSVPDSSRVATEVGAAAGAYMHSQKQTNKHYFASAALRPQPLYGQLEQNKTPLMTMAGGTSVLMSLPESSDGSVHSAAVPPSTATRNKSAIVATGYYNRCGASTAPSSGNCSAVGAGALPPSSGSLARPPSIGVPSLGPSLAPPSTRGGYPLAPHSTGDVAHPLPSTEGRPRGTDWLYASVESAHEPPCSREMACPPLGSTDSCSDASHPSSCGAYNTPPSSLGGFQAPSLRKQGLELSFPDLRPFGSSETQPATHNSLSQVHEWKKANRQSGRNRTNFQHQRLKNPSSHSEA